MNAIIGNVMIFAGGVLAAVAYTGMPTPTVDDAIGIHQSIDVGDDPKEVGQKLHANSRRAWLATWVERSHAIQAGEYTNSMEGAKSFNPMLQKHLAAEWQDFTDYSAEFAKTDPTIDEHYAWEKALFEGYLGAELP